MKIKKFFIAILYILFIFISTSCYNTNSLSSSIENSIIETVTSTEQTTFTTTVLKKEIIVPMIYQDPELPTGCEATAVTMLLQAYGYNVSKEDVARAVPTCSAEIVNGRRYVMHPDVAFYGSPFSNSGFGIFSPAMVEVAQQFVDDNKIAIDLHGSSEEEILSIIDSGAPVCIWASSGNVEIVRKVFWYIKDGDNYTDKLFWWPANQHCLVLTGYDKTTVTVNDPQKGIVKYNREKFFKNYNDIGEYALYIKE